MFLHHDPSAITVLLVYVDDIVITSPNAKMIQELQASLNETFHMKDLGPLNYFLSLEVHQSTKGIVLNQHKYTVDLTDLAGLAAFSSSRYAGRTECQTQLRGW